MKPGPNIEAFVQLSYEKLYDTLPIDIASMLEGQRPLFSDNEGLQQYLDPLFAYFDDPNSQPESCLDFVSALVGINVVRQRIHVSHFFLKHVILPHLYQNNAVQKLLDLFCNDIQKLIKSLSSLYLANKVPVGHCQSITDWLREYYELFQIFQPQYQSILIGETASNPAHKQAWERLTVIIHNELRYAQTQKLHGNLVEVKKHTDRAKQIFETLKSNFVKIIKTNHIDLKNALQLKSTLTTNIETAVKPLSHVYAPMSQEGTTLRIFHTLLTFEKQFPSELAKLRENLTKTATENAFNLENLENQITENIEGVQHAAKNSGTVEHFIIEIKIKNLLTLLSQIDQLPSKQAAEKVLPLLIKLLLYWQNFFKEPDVLMKHNIEILIGFSHLLFTELKILRGVAQVAQAQTRSTCYLKAQAITKPAVKTTKEKPEPVLKAPSKRTAAPKKMAERRLVKAQTSNDENACDVAVQVNDITASLAAIILEDDYKVLGKTIEVPAKIEAILLTLENAGYKAYIKGGFVRDSLLKIAPNDIDIVTDCPVDKLLNNLKNTVTKNHKIPNLFTTKGIDLTCSSLSLLEEGKKSDLTINALFADRTGQVYDPLRIIGDLDKPIFEMVGNAEENLAEDATRLLRLIKARFHVGKEIPPSLINVVKNHMHSLKSIAFGKYLSNIRKLFCSGKATMTWDFLNHNQLLTPMLDFKKSDKSVILSEPMLLHRFVQTTLQTLDSHYLNTKYDNNPYQILGILLLPSLVNICRASPKSAGPAMVDTLLETYCNHFGSNMQPPDRRCFTLATQNVLVSYHQQFLTTLVPTHPPAPVATPSNVALRIAPEYVPLFKRQQQQPQQRRTGIHAVYGNPCPNASI